MARLNLSLKFWILHYYLTEFAPDVTLHYSNAMVPVCVCVCFKTWQDRFFDFDLCTFFILAFDVLCVCVLQKVARYSIGVLAQWSLKHYLDPPKIMSH